MRSSQLRYGYGGRILRVDLTHRRSTVEPLDPSWIKPVIGGRAANTKRLFEELDTDCDPLGPDNLLIFGIGPLTGSMLPASAYYTVSAKSPLTGILGDSAAGGQFGPEMKLTGFDQIIITGAADALLYLMISDEGAQFIECSELSGLNIVETTASIRHQQRDHAIQVAAIGVAGENQVLYASIVSSGNRVNGRTGMGTVMGSKNLKAVAVRGSRPVEFADSLGFLDGVKQLEAAILAHDEYSKRHHMGTTMLMKDLNGIGILPTRHFQEGVCSYVDEISGEKLATTHKVKNKGCFNCNLPCSRYYIVERIEAEGPEFETLCGFTSRIGNRDLPFALEMNRYLNQTGMDSISASEVIGWLMECQDKGIISPADVDGFEIHWGDTDKIREAVEMIAHRRGIGDAMAEGTKRMAQRFGEDAQRLAMQVKGLDIICGDPRGIKAYGLTYAVASRGGDHLRAEPYFELTNRKAEAKRRFGTEKAADRLAEEGKAALVCFSEKIALLTDCLTMCKNVGLCLDVLAFENAARLLHTGTGVRYTPSYLERKLGECIDRDRQLNLRFGITRKDDTLPHRFRTESLPEGPTKGSTVDIDRMVDEYYELHGWDNQPNSKPKTDS
ncbi:MAG: aldehyde ferredoxin oxidoreductase family protein [bacterium]|nr:aldehyde ferredoxin oxidoreductase family protein [bacterium]